MSWEEKVRKVNPMWRVRAAQGKNIKLNTNECPYPPAPGVEAVLRELAGDINALRLYPDMDATPLVNALAHQYGVAPEQIFVGVGSDDVLALCFLTFFSMGGTEMPMFPASPVLGDVWANLYRIPFRAVPLRDDFSIDPEDYLPEVTGQANCGIIFPNPNAPTGLELAQEDVERIIAGNPDSIVIVDEALYHWGQISPSLIEKI